ncbi:MAG: hypothetical protein KGL04_04830 [Elusimicrobia bacterium]|nr:hypothetical protein [Elusimicrobiota bacterium]MDE2313482.1 hypothetical protein [Elusimicrobiota bacterium]
MSRSLVQPMHKKMKKTFAPAAGSAPSGEAADRLRAFSPAPRRTMLSFERRIQAYFWNSGREKSLAR